MQLSKKKESELYNVIYEEIMQARIKIARLTNGNNKLGETIDDVMYKLGMVAPQKSVELFRYKNRKNT